MARWRGGSKRWHFDVNQSIKKSEALFAPHGLTWKHRGTYSELYHRGKMIWSTIGFISGYWDHPTGCVLARSLNAYVNTPIKSMMVDRASAIASSSCYRGYFNEHMLANWQRLPKILLAGDRRVGKNYLGTWLFMEDDQTVIDIIGSRL